MSKRPIAIKHINVKCCIPGCTKSIRYISRKLCDSHYYRLRRYGDPLGGSTYFGQPEAFLLGLRGHQGSDCVMWPFGGGRYGVIVYRGARMSASRCMCEIANGPPREKGLDAAHSCGKGHLGCVNPNHLRWATRLENAADKIMHGESIKGSKNPNAVLSESNIRSIRSEYGPGTSAAKLAARYGVSRGTISHITNRRTWTHVI